MTLTLRIIVWSVCLSLGLGLLVVVMGWITGVFHNNRGFGIEHAIFASVVFGVGVWMWLDFGGSLLHQLVRICCCAAGSSVEPSREGWTWAFIVLNVNTIAPSLITVFATSIILLLENAAGRDHSSWFLSAAAGLASVLSLVWVVCYPPMAIAAYAVTQSSIAPIDVVHLYGRCLDDPKWRSDLLCLIILAPVGRAVVIFLSVLVAGAMGAFAIFIASFLLDSMQIDPKALLVDIDCRLLVTLLFNRVHFGQTEHVTLDVVEIFGYAFMGLVIVFLFSMVSCYEMNVLGLVLKRNQNAIGYESLD